MTAAVTIARVPSSKVFVQGRVAADTVTGATSSMVKGIVDAAREIQKRRELHDVVGRAARS